MERKLVICMVLFLAGIASFNFTYSLMDENINKLAEYKQQVNLLEPLPQAEEVLKPNPIQEEVKIMDPIYIDDYTEKTDEITENGSLVSSAEKIISEVFN